MQATSIAGHLKAGDKPTNTQVNTANELLARALLAQNVPPWFLESKAFKAYVQLVSQGRYSSPSRYTLLRSIRDLTSVIRGEIERELKMSPFMSLEQDGMSKQHRKFIGVTGGGPGKKLFVGCYNIDGSETADMRISACRP